MARRQHLVLTFVAVLFAFCTLSYLFSGPSRYGLSSQSEPLKEESRSEFSIDLAAMPTGILEGEAKAPKLENATLKAELGHATWKFLHTMMARFPDKPTKEDRQALESFMHLFARLYPCGQCARHFQKVLAQYPPQTSSRNAAAGWLCFAHNIVNERVHKPLFDCNKIGDFYDCGCGDEDKKKMGEVGATGDEAAKGKAEDAAKDKAENAAEDTSSEMHKH